VKRTLFLRLALALALAACGGESVKLPEKPPDPQRASKIGPPDDVAERDNLLNYAHGAVVVSRTGEATLKNSALRTIDGDRDQSSYWSSPPNDSQQTFVFAIPSRSRLTQVGAEIGANSACKLRFEASLDGQHFADLATIQLAQKPGPQLFGVPPAEAGYLRVSLDAGLPPIELRSLHARGTPLEPVKPGLIAGCWTAEARSGGFAQHGAHAAGQMDGALLDGGSDGRFYRFVLLKGPEYGLAAISVTPDGQHMSGIRWHEEAIDLFVAESWIGTRAACREQPMTGDEVFRYFIERLGRYPMYGLRFDDSGRLMEEESAFVLDRVAAFAKTTPIRLVGNELFQPSPERNRAVAQAKLDSLRAALAKRGVDVSRIELVNHGGDRPHREALTEAGRSLYGAVELVIPSAVEGPGRGK